MCDVRDEILRTTPKYTMSNMNATLRGILIILFMAVLPFEGRAAEKGQAERARILSIASDDIVKLLESSRGTLRRKTVDSKGGQTFTLHFRKAGLFKRTEKVSVKIRDIEWKGSSAFAIVSYAGG